ncbi:glucose-1-phosphate adenylyltransferase [Bacillus sp. VT 712]|uniref:Glucose-1-phosphate adenylyltransferase n=1 Tax=Priestia veravalensis TaxID=1414648 RepID=A0A0V8JJW8_9BACI|nr:MULTISPECIES: sugar phosphate nucleotidyltransferase [Bacillaceae]KSU87295.1 glucose-1-phosphate adenylyltransferase [Priestia veravalensis]KZB92614.1 glucose-1-phosphate adenylyltransferase [Bacillus sp. VT 712]SCC40021.1 glucose-1-phosphate adenylyltransferase [Priestia flexa]
MNNQMLGIIDACTTTSSLQPLTFYRSIAAVPFAGRYRLIDFMLSNMVNSGVQSVAIFPKDRYRALTDHIGSGKEWDLDRKRDGLFIFPPVKNDLKLEDPSLIAQFRYHIDYFLRSKQDYVIIANSYTICTIDFNQVLKRHVAQGAVVTSVVNGNTPLNIYIINKKALLDILQNETQDFDTITELVHYLSSSSKVITYEQNGYLSQVDSLEAYYKASMDILSAETWKQLFLRTRPIYTKTKDEPPTRYAKTAVVKNSMIANGCVIEGHVENSIIFRGVKIGKGAVVKNSIVMQKGAILENSVLNYVVLDKDVKIGSHEELNGEPNLPRVLAKGTVQGALMNS